VSRFCTSCQAVKNEAGGVFKRVNKTARWICLDCLEKRSESLYKAQSGRPADVRKLFARLQARA
jgi:hypothetical protein